MTEIVPGKQHVPRWDIVHRFILRDLDLVQSIAKASAESHRLRLRVALKTIDIGDTNY